MRRYIAALVLFAYACAAHSQVVQKSSNRGSPAQGPPVEAFETYSDTLRTIQRWVESQEGDDLARLFTIGDVRASDLVAACRTPEQEIAGAAFLTLQLLGKSECESCADVLSQMRDSPAVACGANMSEADFDRVEHWLAKKRKGNGYECGDDYEPLTPMDDSIVYALILEGSSRSRSLLDGMLGFERACATGPTMIGEILEQAASLIIAAKEVVHGLRVEPDRLESSVRASEFFLPQEYRKDSKVEVIARSRTQNRILLAVSYRCGNLCGAGYYVMLRKDGADWHYAVIRMAWIS